MRRTPFLAAVVFLLAFAVYAATAARTVTLVDSGELILTAATLGVAHPPGVPVYTLLGHLASLLPVGSIAFRLGLMSAFFGAVAAALAAWIGVEIERLPVPAPAAGAAGRKARRQEKKGAAPASAAVRPSAPAWLAALPPAAAGLALAWSQTLWSYSVVAEVYTLNLALVAAVFALLLAWGRLDRSEAPAWMLPAAGLLYGLGLGVHHVTVILAFPAFAYLLLRRPVRDKLRIREILGLAAGGAVGLASYLYLPWAAGREPLLAWGDPRDLQHFFWHVSARQYQTNLFSGASQAFAHLAEFGKTLAGELTLLGLALAVVGLVRLWRRRRPAVIALLLLAVCGVGYAINYDIAEDTGAYYLVTFLAVAVMAGSGLAAVAEWAAGHRPREWAAAGLAALLPLANLGLHGRANDRRDDRIARHYVEDFLAGLPPRSLVLTLDWQLYSPFLYLHHLEGMRPDVTMVNVNLVRRSWYVETYLPRAAPKLMALVRPEAEAFLVELKRWERGEPSDPNVLTARFTGLLNAMLARHAGPAHLTVPVEPGVGQGYLWVPNGLTFALSPAGGPPPAAPPLPPLHLDGLVAGPGSEDPVVTGKVRPTYAEMLGQRSRYLAAAGQLAQADEPLATALRLAPEDARLHLLAGDLARTRGDLDRARRSYETAARLAPGDPEVAARLAAVGG